MSTFCCHFYVICLRYFFPKAVQGKQTLKEFEKDYKE